MGNKNKTLTRILIITLLVILIVVGYFFQKSSSVNSLSITILNPNKNFINEKNIKNILSSKNLSHANAIKREDIKTIEYILKQNPLIDSVEVYINNGSELKIVIQQLEPIARVFTDSGASFYLNNKNVLVPSSLQYSARTVMVTGYSKIAKDSVMKNKLFDFLKSMKNDSLWNVQIQQIHFVSTKLIELYPELGNHKILLGDFENVENKMLRLKTFYQKVLSKQGFDMYKELDLRFDNQLLARPSIKINSIQINS